MDDVVGKPYSLTELIDRMRSVVSKVRDAEDVGPPTSPRGETLTLENAKPMILPPPTCKLQGQ
jgi:DNA-binding response OmpR family regulator